MKDSFRDALVRGSRCSEPVGFYVSFADPVLPKGEQFLGVAIVPAATMEMALTRSHLRGYNPGGQAVLVPIAVLPPAEWLDRLLSKDEVDDLGVVMEKLLS